MKKNLRQKNFHHARWSRVFVICTEIKIQKHLFVENKLHCLKKNDLIILFSLLCI